MKIRHEIYDTKGNILSTEMIDVSDPVIPEPDDLTVRVKALEIKANIQPQDIEAAKAILMSEPLLTIEASPIGLK